MKLLPISLILLVSACTPQQIILREVTEIKNTVLLIQKEQSEIRNDISKLDERYRTEQITLNRYEKQQIKSRIDTTDVDQLFEYLKSMLSTEKNLPVKRN